ncbi:BON domain-containing protein [Telmatobacter sp. DSM 110680]|uniref:BON domain-containing protein n=1 Tax=Telmatobacter sp. DSM 110680 TaxID=3036704 RepID=A0AAU7DGS2_9BACT
MIRSSLLLSSTLLVTALACPGCGHNDHPDDKMAVYSALDQNYLRSITVSQDRQAGTITLSGIVGSPDRVQKAEQIAQQAAPGYSIVNHIQVENAGLQNEMKSAQQNAILDSAIEDRYKATLAAHQSLQNIQYSAFNGTLTLKGSVKSYQDRQEAENLAKQVPRVQHVVNEIQITTGKPSSTTS